MCRYARRDAASFYAPTNNITQPFRTNSTLLLLESLTKQIRIVWKSESTEATQACKQWIWLPLQLSVSLTTLLIHLSHNRATDHNLPQYTANTFHRNSVQTIERVFIFWIALRFLWYAEMRGRHISGSLGLRSESFSWCLLVAFLSSALP